MNQQKFNPAVASKRRQKDIMKLLMSEYKVTQSKEQQGDLIVEFQGPKNTLYENGTWQIHVLLPEQYPYKSPSIGFNNKIFHPNVDEGSGSVCLDVINQAWSPMYDLVNVFEQFLPQLLSYPNPTDPLNPDAASLMLKNEKKYEDKVKDYVQKYAIKQQQPVLEKQKSQNMKPINGSMNSSNLFKKDRKLSDLCNRNSSAGGSTDDQIDDDEVETGNKGKKRSQDFTKDLLNDNQNNTQDNNKQEQDGQEEEDEQVSNISLDDVSELSELSELEMNEEECCY